MGLTNNLRRRDVALLVLTPLFLKRRMPKDFKWSWSSTPRTPYWPTVVLHVFRSSVPPTETFNSIDEPYVIGPVFVKHRLQQSVWSMPRTRLVACSTDRFVRPASLRKAPPATPASTISLALVSPSMLGHVFVPARNAAPQA